jgi:hypothetical protein
MIGNEARDEGKHIMMNGSSQIPSFQSYWSLFWGFIFRAFVNRDSQDGASIHMPVGIST